MEPSERDAVNVDKLTSVLAHSKSASFLRLGDGELRFLLECFSGEWIDGKYDALARKRGPTEARGTLGLRYKDFIRLCDAYQNATVVDVYRFVPFNSQKLVELKGKLPIPNSVSSTASHILVNEWTAESLKSFLRCKRVVFCGGESRLLEQLLHVPVYRDVSSEFWPHGDEAGIYFCHPIDDGRDPSLHLDDLKSELLTIIRRERLDAVILSLGGIAKILAAEVALEANVIGIDFGGMLRALVYSGSDGHAFWRSTHNPFLFRIPLETWMDSLLKAQPWLSDLDQMAKAQCQLTLDLQRKERGQWINSDVHEPASLELSSENLKTFHSNYDHYRNRFRALMRQEPFRQQFLTFEDWCFSKKIPGTRWLGPGIRSIGSRIRQKFRKITKGIREH
jgi:hypothetical protein